MATETVLTAEQVEEFFECGAEKYQHYCPNHGNSLDGDQIVRTVATLTAQLRTVTEERDTMQTALTAARGVSMELQATANDLAQQIADHTAALASLRAKVARLPSPWKRTAWGGHHDKHVDVEHKCEWCEARHTIAITDKEWDKARYPDDVPHPDNDCLWADVQKLAADGTQRARTR